MKVERTITRPPFRPSRRGDRFRRRNPRRGRDRAQGQTQRPACAAFGLASAYFPISSSRNGITAKPDRIVSALEIMLEGPIGAAAFNNEFGRPNLAGYFRAFEENGPTGSGAAITNRS